MFRELIAVLPAVIAWAVPLAATDLTLQALVMPSTVVMKDGRPVTFAVHGVVEFRSLSELFPYIDLQTHRWNLTNDQRRALTRRLLRGGIESRVISMVDERPLELLVTHTVTELKQALARVTEPLPDGYAREFLVVQEKWKHSLNCWSAAPSIQARVLSNWYPIEEGIQLFGATYDSVEHFWQAVKYHPEMTVAELNQALDILDHNDWSRWLARLDTDPQLYLPHAYAIEFLRYNLKPERRLWLREELNRQALSPDDHVRLVQQRGANAFRFKAYQEKVLWGDLADVFHLIYVLSSPEDPIRKELGRRHFDGIYLNGRKMGFISTELRGLMMEAWKVKYLKIPRFGEVIRSIPQAVRLEHFLNDGDSPDIPIPIYVEYLNQIRALARQSRP